MSEYTNIISDLPYKSLEECEKALKEQHNAEYGKISSQEYTKRSHNIKHSISRIFMALSECANCDEVLQALNGREHRLEAFERYLRHDNYMSVFYRIF